MKWNPAKAAACMASSIWFTPAAVSCLSSAGGPIRPLRHCVSPFFQAYNFRRPHRLHLRIVFILAIVAFTISSNQRCPWQKRQLQRKAPGSRFGMESRNSEKIAAENIITSWSPSITPTEKPLAGFTPTRKKPLALPNASAARPSSNPRASLRFPDSPVSSQLFADYLVVSGRSVL